MMSRDSDVFRHAALVLAESLGFGELSAGSAIWPDDDAEAVTLVDVVGLGRIASARVWRGWFLCRDAETGAPFVLPVSRVALVGPREMGEHARRVQTLMPPGPRPL